MRIDAPKNQEKKLYENRCSEKNPEENDMNTEAPKINQKKKRYEKRGSEAKTEAKTI